MFPAAPHRHGNYRLKLTQYFMEWHFYSSLPSISAPSTQFSAHAFGGVVQLLLHLLSSDASPSRPRSPCAVLSFAFIKTARQKSMPIIYPAAQKSVLIQWSQKRFNPTCLALESAEGCLLFEVFGFLSRCAHMGQCSHLSTLFLQINQVLKR